MTELEEILETFHPLNDQVVVAFEEIEESLFQLLAKLISSVHFQVAERASFLWNNQTLSSSGCLSFVFAVTVLPILYPILAANIEGQSAKDSEVQHWNSRVASRTVLKSRTESKRRRQRRNL